MYTLTNFMDIFEVIYNGFKCRLKFVLSELINKELHMQKNNVKAFICSPPQPIVSEKNDWDLLKIDR